MGALPELSRTSTETAVLKPAGTNPDGTAPVGKVIRVAKIWGGAAEEEEEELLRLPHAGRIAHRAATISQSATWPFRLPRRAGALR
jgi:hypothetical protein